MNKDKYVFAQLIEFLDNNKFRHLVDKYDGNRYVKHFTCWKQLLASISPIQRPHYITSSYTYQFLKKILDRFRIQDC